MATSCSPTAAPRKARLQALSLSREDHPWAHPRAVRSLDTEAARCLHDFVVSCANRITATETASADGLSRRGCFNRKGP
jgi:hypothetical protein